jgi:hypothetical protein
MSRWAGSAGRAGGVAKSTRALAAELTRRGQRVSADTVGDLLRAEGFSLQGKRHPDRDAQFRYISEQARAHQAAGQPVISVDTKKKELVGAFRNGGREWRPEGEPARVSTHDFPDLELGNAIPYGVYDVAANAGWVNWSPRTPAGPTGTVPGRGRPSWPLLPWKPGCRSRSATSRPAPNAVA